MLMTRAAGFLFANHDPHASLNSALCKKDPFVFDNSNTMLVPIAQEYAIDPSGRPLVGFRFITNVTNAGSSPKAISKVYAPTSGTYSTVFSQIPMHYGELYTGPVYKYSSPFTLVVCGDLAPSQIEQTRQAIKSAWLNVRPDLAACDCFDVTVIGVDKFTANNNNGAASSYDFNSGAPLQFTDTNNRISTQLTYLGLAKEQVIEASNSPPESTPSQANIFAALAPYGLSQCSVRSGRSTLLDVVVASPSLAQPDFDALERSIFLI